MSDVPIRRVMEGVALLLSGSLLRCEVEWKEVSSRLMWVRVKIERESWIFISAYGPGSERSENEIKEFWSRLRECAGSFGGNESVEVLGNLNDRVGNEVIEGIVGLHGMPGRNESGKRLLEMCAEQMLVVSNSWFKKEDEYKYTWLKMAEGMVADRSLMDGGVPGGWRVGEMC